MALTVFLSVAVLPTAVSIFCVSALPRGFFLLCSYPPSLSGLLGSLCCRIQLQVRRVQRLSCWLPQHPGRSCPCATSEGSCSGQFLLLPNWCGVLGTRIFLSLLQVEGLLLFSSHTPAVIVQDPFLLLPRCREKCSSNRQTTCDL